MTIQFSLKRKDNYTLILIVTILVLFLAMLGTFYKIKEARGEQNLLLQKDETNGFMLPPSMTKKPIYLCTSKYTANYYMKNGLSKEDYVDHINKFAKLLSSLGYTTNIVPLSQITSLDKNSIVFLLDAQSLSDENKKDIKKFIKNGGSFFFNYISGYRDDDGNYKADKFVKSITGLSLTKRGFAEFKGGLNITLKLLSPFSSYLNTGQLLEASVYDSIPLYNTNTKTTDIFANAYNQSTPPTTKNLTDSIKISESGLAWHGYLGEGKWIYTSLPSYSFYDIKKYRDDFKKIVAGMIKFLSQKAVVQMYSYIDQKSVVFISEDTEYKYQNFKKFADLAYKYKIPVTAFIVASIATRAENIELTKSLASNPYVEYASHSTTHTKIVGQSEKYIINETTNSKKIIDKFASKPIIGFRPPREELNDLMEKHLQSSGYFYVLGAIKDYLYPRFEKKFPRLLYIPRRGTDDYSFLVNLDWSQRDILRQVIKEMKFVTALDGIYTFSMHTHLFAYKSNINIVENFFRYLKKHPEYKVLDGRHLALRVALRKNLKLDYNPKTNKVTITNNNPVEIRNIKVKVFAKNPKTIRVLKLPAHSTKMITLQGI